MLNSEPARHQSRQKRKVLFVCSANRCRSPLAMALFEALTQRKGVEHLFQVDSAGVWAYDGEPATSKAIQVLKETTGSSSLLERHRSKALTVPLLEEATEVLVMESKHREAILEHFDDKVPGLASKVHRLADFSGGAGDIRDPVLEDTIEEYRVCAKELDEWLPPAFHRLLGDE